MDTVQMFIIGLSLKGEAGHDATLGDATFLREARTEPAWGLHLVDGTYPALRPSEPDGTSIKGELYELSFVSFQDRMLPQEPPELEMTVVTLDDGTGAVAMKLREDVYDNAPHRLRDISEFGGWRGFRQSSGHGAR